MTIFGFTVQNVFSTSMRRSNKLSTDKQGRDYKNLKSSGHLRQGFSRYDVAIMVIQIWYVNFITPGAGILELACGQFGIWSLKLSNNSAKFMIQDAKVLMILDSQSVYSLCRSDLKNGEISQCSVLNAQVSTKACRLLILIKKI